MRVGYVIVEVFGFDVVSVDSDGGGQFYAFRLEEFERALV